MFCRECELHNGIIRSLLWEIAAQQDYFVPSFLIVASSLQSEDNTKRLYIPGIDSGYSDPRTVVDSFSPFFVQYSFDSERMEQVEKAIALRKTLENHMKGGIATLGSFFSKILGIARSVGDRNPGEGKHSTPWKNAVKSIQGVLEGYNLHKPSSESDDAVQSDFFEDSSESPVKAGSPQNGSEQESTYERSSDSSPERADTLGHSGHTFIISIESYLKELEFEKATEKQCRDSIMVVLAAGQRTLLTPQDMKKRREASMARLD